MSNVLRAIANNEKSATINIGEQTISIDLGEQPGEILNKITKFPNAELIYKSKNIIPKFDEFILRSLQLSGVIQIDDDKLNAKFRNTIIAKFISNRVLLRQIKDKLPVELLYDIIINLGDSSPQNILNNGMYIVLDNDDNTMSIYDSFVYLCDEKNESWFVPPRKLMCSNQFTTDYEDVNEIHSNKLVLAWGNLIKFECISLSDIYGYLNSSKGVSLDGIQEMVGKNSDKIRSLKSWYTLQTLLKVLSTVDIDSKYNLPDKVEITGLSAINRHVNGVLKNVKGYKDKTRDKNFELKSDYLNIHTIVNNMNKDISNIQLLYSNLNDDDIERINQIVNGDMPNDMSDNYNNITVSSSNNMTVSNTNNRLVDVTHDRSHLSNTLSNTNNTLNNVTNITGNRLNNKSNVLGDTSDDISNIKTSDNRNNVLNNTLNNNVLNNNDAIAASRNTYRIYDTYNTYNKYSRHNEYNTYDKYINVYRNITTEYNKFNNEIMKIRNTPTLTYKHYIKENNIILGKVNSMLNNNSLISYSIKDIINDNEKLLSIDNEQNVERGVQNNIDNLEYILSYKYIIEITIYNNMLINYLNLLLPIHRFYKYIIQCIIVILEHIYSLLLRYKQLNYVLDGSIKKKYMVSQY